MRTLAPLLRLVSWLGLSLSVCAAMAAQAPDGFRFTPTRERAQNVVYDPLHQRFFVTVPGENAVYVTSESTGALLGKVSVPSAYGLALSPDNTSLYVTSSVSNLGQGAAEGFFVVDPVTLHVVDFVQPGYLQSNAQVLGYVDSPHLVPKFIAPLSDGRIAYVAEHKSVTGGTVYIYDPRTGIATYASPAYFYDGIVAASRNGNGFVTNSEDSAGTQVAVYDTASSSFAGNLRITITNSADTVLSPDGSEVLVGGRYLYNRAMVQTGDLAAQLGGKAGNSVAYAASTFSPDGTRIYVLTTLTDTQATSTGGTATYGNSVIAVYNAATAQFLGYVPVPFRTGSAGPYAAIAATNNGTVLIISASYSNGFLELNASQPSPTLNPDVTQSLSIFPASSGVVGSPAPLTINGNGFRSGAQVYFGQVAVPTTVVSSTQLQVQPPPGTPGAVDVSLAFPDGWTVLAPQAYTYGPVFGHQDVTAGDASGGAVVRILGFGLDAQGGGSPSVAVGGRPATVTAFASYNGQPTLTFTTPAGPVGPADIQIRSQYGTLTVPNGFRYLREQTVPSVAPISMVVDETRGLLYVADAITGNVIAVDQKTLATHTVFSSAQSPAYALAITPDASKLLVVSYAGFTLDVIDLNTGKDLKTITPAIAGVGNRYAPEYVAATSRGTPLVTGYDTDTYLQGATLEVDLATGISYPLRSISNTATEPSVLAPTPDGTLVYMTLDGQLQISSGALDLWGAQSGGSVTCCGFGDEYQLATDDLGDRVWGDGYTFDSQLRMVTTQAPDSFLGSTSPVYGARLHSSGGLIYNPIVDGVQITDTHHGNMDLWIGVPERMLAGPQNLAITHDGSTLFVASRTGLRIIDLDQTPLSIGSLTPSSGDAAGGTAVLLRGSGFVPGTSVSIDGRAAQVQFLDPTRLQIVTPSVTPAKDVVAVTTPDGRAYSLDAAFDATAPAAADAPVLDRLGVLSPLVGQMTSINVFGSGFKPGVVVMLDGKPGITTFLTSTQIQVTFVDLPGPETATINAQNIGSATSNPLSLGIYSAGPLLGSLSPSSAQAGSAAFTLEALSPGYFSPHSTVLWNGSPRPTVYLSNGQLLATISASDIASVGTASVTVYTPQTLSGMTTSSPLTFTITQPAPGLTLSSKSVGIGPLLEGGAVASSTLTLTSAGQAPLAISSISLPAGTSFSVSHNCPASLAPGQTCTVTLTFDSSGPVAPTYTPGTTLTIASNVGTTTVPVSALEGYVALFPSTGSVILTRGASGNFSLAADSYGYFPGATLQLSCSGLPAGASCSFSPASLTMAPSTLGGNSVATTTVTISTAAAHAAPSRVAAIAAAVGLLLLGCARRRKQIPILLGLALLLATGISGCSGATSPANSSGNGGTGSSNGGTPPGFYNIYVTATSGKSSFTSSVQLIVE